MLRDTDLVIGDTDYGWHLAPVVAGEPRKMGLIPRDYLAFPRGSYPNVKAVDVPLIDMSEWPDRIREKAEKKSQLSDIRLYTYNSPMASLDQDGVGYCWAHSPTSANMLLRALANLEYVPLSAFCVAATIKRGADQGGWGAQGLDFIVTRGQASQRVWPQGRRDYRTLDRPEVWADAARFKVTEGFIDTAVAQYDRDLSNHQTGTLLLSNVPVVCDYNWWGHSVCGMDLVDVYPNRSATDFRRYGIRIWNSWSDAWGDRGTSVLKDSRAWPDGATAPRVSIASTA